MKAKIIVPIILLLISACKPSFTGKYNKGDCFNPGNWSNMTTGEHSTSMDQTLLTIISKDIKNFYYTVRVYSNKSKQFYQGGFSLTETALDKLGKTSCPKK